VAVESFAGRGDQQRGRVHARAELVASAQVAAQRLDRRRMQRKLTGFPELAVAHNQARVLEIELAAVKPDRLADPHARDR